MQHIYTLSKKNKEAEGGSIQWQHTLFFLTGVKKKKWEISAKKKKKKRKRKWMKLESNKVRTLLENLIWSSLFSNVPRLKSLGGENIHTPITLSSNSNAAFSDQMFNTCHQA